MERSTAGDVAFGVAGLVLAAGYYLMASGIQESQLADAVGPQGLPKIYALVLAALSAILIARSRPRAFEVEQAEPGTPRHALVRAAGLLAFGGFYLFVVEWLGYVVSIAALIAVTTWYQGRVINRQIVLVAISGAILFWVMFVLVLGVQHPPGFWPSLF